jgi:hypothetical protein
MNDFAILVVFHAIGFGIGFICGITCPRRAALAARLAPSADPECKCCQCRCYRAIYDMDAELRALEAGWKDTIGELVTVKNAVELTLEHLHAAESRVRELEAEIERLESGPQWGDKT